MLWGSRTSVIPALPNIPPMHRPGGKIPSTPELRLGFDADFYTVTGSGSISKLPNRPRGTTITLAFTGTPTFFNSAKLVCPAGANFTAAPNDVVVALSAGDGAWTLVWLPAAGARRQLTANTTFYVRTAAVTCTISNASPAVVSATAHGLQINDPVVFNSSGALPTGLTLGQVYYVISAGYGANAFEVSASLGGSAINTSSGGSGTQSFQTGNDANNGLAQTRTGALLTPQQAWNTVAALDLNSYVATIQLANGVYTTGITSGTQCAVGAGNAGSIVINGNASSNTSVYFSCALAGLGVFEFGTGTFGTAKCTIQNLALANSGSGGSGINVWGSGCNVAFNNIYFGPCTLAQVGAFHGAVIMSLGGTNQIAGGATYMLLAETGGQQYYDAATWTFSNSPAYSGATMLISDLGVIMAGSNTYTNGGTVTGQKYQVVRNGSLFTGNATTGVPGSTSGATNTGGQAN